MVVVASRTLRLLQAADTVARAVPLTLSSSVARRVGAHLGPRLMPNKARLLERHLDRVADYRLDTGHSGARATVGHGFGSYARYWAESIALPHLSTTQIDRGFSFVGYDHLEDVRATGRGPLVVLPHLGGWEWAAAWLGRVARVPVTAVVEALEPEDVFEWFRRLRSSYRVNVVPLGPDAFAQITTAVREGHVICLLSDRDLGGTGVEVEFFGETTTMPVGPALLSIRTGAPVVPTAVYFHGDQRICMVGKPLFADTVRSLTGIETGRASTGRRRYRHLTQLYARELEHLIEAAPSQWHLLGPNWPSDHRAAVN